jgi:hypothetical protein
MDPDPDPDPIPDPASSFSEFFLHIFSYNLPVGTLSSVLKLQPITTAERPNEIHPFFGKAFNCIHG